MHPNCILQTTVHAFITAGLNTQKGAIHRCDTSVLMFFLLLLDLQITHYQMRHPSEHVTLSTHL